MGLTVISVLVMAVALVTTMVLVILHVNAKAMEIAETDLLNQVKNGVQTTTQAVVKNSLAQYEKDKDSMSEKELVDLILDNIRNTQYSDTGYYFVYMYDGTRLVAPENPSQEGQNLWDLTDEAGNKPVQEFITQAKAGGGFVTYMWVNPATKTAEQKVSYVAPLVMGSTEVLVGTGTYLPMLQQAQDEMSASQQNIINTVLWYTIPAAAVLLLAIMLLLYALIMRRVIRPLKKVTTAATKIAEGDADAVLDVNTNDEIGRVARTIDGEVRQAFKSIAASQAVLEKRDQYQKKHVEELVVNLERLAKGELYCDMTVQPADEDMREMYEVYKSISDNLHKSVDTIRGYIEEISQVLGEITNGNLDALITSDYQGVFVELRDSINGILDSLNDTLHGINTAADEVAAGTKQVVSGQPGDIAGGDRAGEFY